MNKKQPNEFHGAITDGQYNLDITIINYQNNTEQGNKIRVTGEIEEIGTN